MLREDRRVRAVHHHEAPRGLRVLHGEAPGDGAAPVVADDHRLALAERLDQPAHVGDQLGERVRRHAGRLVAQVVAAEIGRDGAETGCEGRDLVPPRVPALRKAVQQDDERPVAVDRAVELDAVGRDGAVLEGHCGPA